MADTPSFGARKEDKSILDSFEQKFLKQLLPLIPRSVETYHLTLLSLVWCLLSVFSGFLAKGDLSWLWLMNGAILGHYITDFFDGLVGRVRNTGLVRWGFYMDHLFDYLFLCSILIGYAFITPYEYKYILFFTLSICGGFLAHSFLYFGATGKFKITFLEIGPSEIRVLFILINLLLIFFGKVIFISMLPYVFILCLLGFIIVVFRTAIELWKLDMKIKNSPPTSKKDV